MTDTNTTRRLSRFEWERIFVTAGIGKGTLVGVGLAMATYADQASGSRIYPGVSKLAEGLGVTDRTVIRSVAELERLGYITKLRHAHPGKGLATEWCLTAPAETGDICDRMDDTGVTQAGDICDQMDDMSDETGDTGDEIGDTDVTPSTMHQPSINQSITHENNQHNKPASPDPERSSYLTPRRTRSDGGDERERFSWQQR